MWEWFAVGSIGGLVGIGELAARYRDAPSRALKTVPAVFYVGLNVIASLVALKLIRDFGWSFGIDGTGKETAKDLTQVLVAGFGAMALFRSSLFIVRVGEQDVGVGPSGFLQVALGASDRAVDRLRGGSRATAVAKIMNGVVFTKAYAALPVFCLALMQNVSQEEQARFGEQIAALARATMDDKIKSLNLGLALMNVVGEEVLKAAVDSLGAEIRQ